MEGEWAWVKTWQAFIETAVTDSRRLLKQQASSHLSEVWGDEEDKHTHLNARQRENKMHFEQQRKTFTVVFDVTVSTCCFRSAHPILEIL